VPRDGSLDEKGVKMCGVGMTTQILVGLYRVGVIGLRDALVEARDAGITEREAVVERLLERLGGRNYLPPDLQEPYRVALWREFQRLRGEDIRDLFSEVEVEVRGEPGEERDRFVAMMVSIFGGHELKPAVTFTPPEGPGPFPQLMLEGEAIVKGMIPRKAFHRAVQQNITDW
jgi:hypothetical protein